MPDKTRQSEKQNVPNGKTNWAALDAMTDDDAEAAALSDPDAPPLRDGQTLSPMSPAKRVRFNLRLSRQEFSDRYHIPLATIVSWERHETKPDAVATAFLDAIAADPEGLAKALARSSGKPEAAE
jgi:putative transcriptional regulator